MKNYDADRIHWIKNHVPTNRDDYLEIARHANVMPVDFPRTVYLEVGQDCNLNCSFCSKPTRKKFTREMDAETLARVVDECAENGVYGLYLHLFNEPLLHVEKLIPVIRRAKEGGIPIVAVTTNGTPLTEKIMNDLIESGLDTLHFSFEGANAELYQQVRGAKASVIERRIEMALRIREEQGRRNDRDQPVPWIAITSVRTDETDEEVAEFLTKWKGTVDDIEIRPALGFLGRTVFRDWEQPEKRVACRYLGDRIIIAADGSVIGCSVDVDAELCFGNVIDGQTIREIWHSDDYREIWSLHQWQAWDKLPEPCKSCDSWDFTATKRSQFSQETAR